MTKKQKNVGKLVRMTRRFSILFLLIMLFCSFSTMAALSQQGSKITISETKISLSDLLWKIQNQTQYEFVFDDEDLEEFEKLNVSEIGSIEEILNSILEDKDLTYEKKGKVFVIKKEVPKTAPQVEKKEIKGKVVDDKGVPLPGVSVVIKGTNVGVATNIDGEYFLEFESESIVLIYSFVGMIPREITYSGQQFINVTLSANSEQMEEVVVTGYQKVDRKLFTGAASRVDIEDVKLAGEADITKSLEGRVAGVSIQTVSSTFGAAPKIRIRGSSSIYGGQKPLWVVDGIVLEDAKEVSMDEIIAGDVNSLISSGVAGLNMDDVASVQILSDGSATAIYGARAMNGVILITTKSGRKGKLDVNYSTSVSVKPIPRYEDYNILNSVDQMSINRELYEKGWTNVAKTQTSSIHGPYGKLFDLVKENDIYWSKNTDQINAFLRKYETANTNWFKELFKPGVQQQHTISMSGGSDKVNFYTSLGYLNDAGWTIADDVDRYTALLKGVFKINDKLKITTQGDLSYREQRLSGVNNSGGVDRFTGKVNRNFDNNPFMYAMNTSRNIRARDENGELEFFRRNFVDYNIIDELDKNQLDITVRDMSLKANFDYKFTDKLSLTSRVSARYFSAKTAHKIHESSNEANAYRAGTRPGDSELIRNANPLLYTRPFETSGIRYSVLPEGGIYNEKVDEMKNYYVNTSLNWNPRIGENNMFTFLLGAEVRYIDRSTSHFDGFGHFYDMGNISKPHPNFLEKLAIDGNTYFGVRNTYERFTASMLNAGYSYKGKYTLNGTFRYEGSNRMGKSRSARWMPSWSISGKWALQEEEFLKGHDWLNQLNLRVGYSLVAERGPASNATVLAGSYTTRRPFHPTLSQLAVSINQPENRDLTWEKQYELNIGLDFTALRNRLNFSANYYRRDAFDLISQYRSNGIGGKETKIGNVADMVTNGIELSLSGTLIQSKKFSWNSSITYSYNKSEITNLLTTNWAGSATSVHGVPVLNGPIRGVYSARFAGLNSDGVPTFFDRNDNKVQFLNLQTSDLSDFEYSGNLEPTTHLGISNTFRYKNLTLSSLISGQFGHVKRVMQNFSYAYSDSQALSGHLKNRWKVKGDELKTDIPAILDADYVNSPKSYLVTTAYNLYGMSNRWIADASFIRLKNVSLNYELPKKFLRKMGLSNAKVGVQATNLGMLWLADKDKLGGEDPEFVWTGGTTMPISKQYTFTLNVGF